jgi:DNA-binding NtrC family response regulator
VSGLHVVRDDDASFFGLLGEHPVMLRLFDAIRGAAALDAPVVVSGPTGSGKELVAHALHDLSDAARGPFCPVNVAALPEPLVESELFGSSRGAFTSAVADRRGLIEAADQGTLFLDEAGDLAAQVQAKLLRALEGGEIRRVGSTAVGFARFRLVIAVRADPLTLLQAGRWRDDFYYRVTGIVLRVPPLAARSSDIPLLARAFARASGLPDIELEAMRSLEQHGWPGNVRELQRALVRAVHHSRGGSITAEAVRSALAETDSDPVPAAALLLGRAKARHVRAMVEACGGDTYQAAVALGISRSHVYRLLRGVSSGHAVTKILPGENGILPGENHENPPPPVPTV